MLLGIVCIAFKTPVQELRAAHIYHINCLGCVQSLYLNSICTSQDNVGSRGNALCQRHYSKGCQCIRVMSYTWSHTDAICIETHKTPLKSYIAVVYHANARGARACQNFCTESCLVPDSRRHNEGEL